MFKNINLDDCNIEVKIKYVGVKDQEYRVLSEYKVKAYWRIECTWFWRSIGIIHYRETHGRVVDITKKEQETFLHNASILVKAHLRGDSINKNGKMNTKFHVSELWK